MRKTASALAIASVALLGTTTAASAGPKQAEPANSTVVPAMTQDTYLSTIRALLAGEPGDAQSDATLIDGGKSICSDIDAGATYDTFEDQMDEYQLNRAVYRVIIRSSVLTFCSQHAGILR